MSSFDSARGAFAGVLTLALFSSGALSQESLPTIEIGAASSSRPGPRAEDKATYRPQNASTALKTNTPIMETPASIQIVPQQVLQDQQATTISRAIENVSGVAALPPLAAGGVEQFYIRGFQTYDYYRDGVRMNSIEQNSGAENIANVDRVEVLKGPASILYGRAEPGGVINLVMKKPEATPFYAVQQQAGSWGTYRTTVDATGPITKDDTLLYRFDFAYENNHDFFQFSGNRNIFVAPRLRWNIDAHTQLDIYLDYKSAAFPKGYAIPGLVSSQAASRVYGAGPLSFLPRGFNTSEPWSRGNSDDVVLGYQFSHDFAEGWNIKHKFQAELVDLTSQTAAELGINIFKLPFADRAISADRVAVALPAWHTHTYFTNLDVTGKFDLLDTSHTLLVGGDFQHLDVNGYNLEPALNFSCICYISPLNFNAPVHTSYPTFGYDPTTRSDTAFRENWYGFYLQDQVKLPHDFFLLAGLRYDHSNTYNVVTRRTNDDSQKVSPRLGLLWRPVEELSVYGSYLTNFGGSNVGAKNPMPPQTAEQWEVGVKSEWFDKRVTATIAYYNLIKQNIPAPNPDPQLAAQGYSVAVGEVRNRGVELDVAGEILSGWKVIGSYSYIDSLITKDNGRVTDTNGVLVSVTGNKGHTLFNVPRHSGSLWTTYEFQNGDWRGLKLGGGVVARGIRQGDNANDFQLPGYATVGLMAGYDFKLEGATVKLQFNVDNLADTRYYPAASSAAFAIFAGAPRSFKGSVRIEY
ncbi:TonB-dependent siderophore receptor [Methylosinus sp. KRF6]|uniref:TonB-dependent siderophore receptor n=1 Tax=Methylosinus sp. KRF6 TaxID=2846853 RepID=UPI001C0C4031|nr:TonB-dependent siderophore receptor [Methylosinus sp. KRF6]MBU3888038.1 TonB-dependent siderophore receptor [Methylosinus sp. KRF6]